MLVSVILLVIALVLNFYFNFGKKTEETAIVNEKANSDWD